MAQPAALPPPSAPPPHSPLAVGLRLLIVPALVLLVLILVLASVGGTLRWMVVNEAGTRWLLTHLPWVETRGFEGALFGDHWRADRVVLTWAGGKQSVTLEGLVAEGLYIFDIRTRINTGVTFGSALAAQFQHTRTQAA